MIYMLDTGNVKEIERLVDLYPIEGVTTNPSIVAKAKRNIKDLLVDIRKCIGEECMLHAQVIAEEPDDIVNQALHLRDIAKGNFYVKIPVTPNGIKAIKILKKKGMNVTATAVFTQQQALLAAKAGADFVAPYVNRLDNISSDGVGVVSDIMQLFNMYHVNTKVLAASFKNAEQVHRVSLSGVDAATISPELFDKLVYHPLTEKSIEDFIAEGSKYYEGI